MQTQKASNGSPDVPKKGSPRAARPLKLTALEPDSSSSPISANNRTPKNSKSPKVLDRRSPRSPVSEKKRPSRITELETLVSQLQEELKKAKDQATASETSKRQAEQEAEESRKQLEEVSSKLLQEKETDNQECADERTTGGLALVVAQEIRQLKLQIENVASSEAGRVKQAELRNSEIQLLKGNLMDTLFLVENFRNQLKDCEVSDAETEALATETLRQLENAKKAVEELKSDGEKAVESYKKMAEELEQSKSRMVLLETLVNKLQASPEGDYEEVSSLRCEVESLRAALEASDRKDQEASSRLRIQAELQSELKIAKYEIDELKGRLVEKETELQFISEEKDNLYLKLMKTDVETELKEAMENLKADLMDKETELQIVSEENETLKSDVHKRERDVQDVLAKLGIAMEEADKSSKRAARVAEQMDATQASNSEMETELRKLKVQSNQWRKAAEAATAMLSAGNNGNKTNSPYSEDVVDDEVTKKKNGNVLKKIGVLWKKPQK